MGSASCPCANDALIEGHNDGEFRRGAQQYKRRADGRGVANLALREATARGHVMRWSRTSRPRSVSFWEPPPMPSDVRVARTKWNREQPRAEFTARTAFSNDQIPESNRVTMANPAASPRHMKSSANRPTTDE